MSMFYEGKLCTTYMHSRIAYDQETYNTCSAHVAHSARKLMQKLSADLRQAFETYFFSHSDWPGILRAPTVEAQ